MTERQRLRGRVSLYIKGRERKDREIEGVSFYIYMREREEEKVYI